MEQRYLWRMSEPGETLGVHMENWEDGQRVFHATMTMRRHEMSGFALASTLARYPFMSMKVVAAIYWQALRLYLKGAKFYNHPHKQKSTHTRHA